ncbi:MAG: hypothetical protein ACI97A_003036 [Planctomycetota bacterium]|jgi:hypothetical protein
MMIRFCALLVLTVVMGCADKPKPKPEKTEVLLPAEFQLVDATPSSGLDFVTKSGTSRQEFICEVKSTGVGLLDYNSDGLLDVVLVAGSTIDRTRANEAGFGVRLFRNLGGLKFEDVSKEAGLNAVKWGWACAPACADVDGDGDDDIYVTQIGANILLINEDGVFRDQSKKFGVDDAGWGTSSAFADIDADGDLDLYVCNYLEFDFANPARDGDPGFSCKWKSNEVMCGPKGLPQQQDVVYRNEGKGGFRNVTKEWGIADLLPSYGLGVMPGDFDRNGAQELYVANDGMANFHLSWDAKKKKLVDQAWDIGTAVSEDGAPQAGMGIDAADLNGDGQEDFVCTNFSGEVNNLFLSTEDGYFLESSATSGIALASLPSVGWGAAFRDFDLDGRLDLFVANGHVYPQAAKTGTGTDYPQFNQVFRAQPDHRFELLSRIDHPGLAVKKVSRGAAFGDLDNDGDVDVLVCNLGDRPTLIENRTRSKNAGPDFVGIECAAQGWNSQGLGAVVLIDQGKASSSIRRHASFQSSNDWRVIFAGKISEVVVSWPSGKQERFDVKQNKYNKLTEGSGKK